MNKIFGKISLILLATFIFVDKSSAVTVEQATAAITQLEQRIGNLLTMVTQTEVSVNGLIGLGDGLYQDANKKGNTDNIHPKVRNALRNIAQQFDGNDYANSRDAYEDLKKN